MLPVEPHAISRGSADQTTSRTLKMENNRSGAPGIAETDRFSETHWRHTQAMWQTHPDTYNTHTHTLTNTLHTNTHLAQFNINTP